MFIFSTHLHSRGSTNDAILEGLRVDRCGLCNSFSSVDNESVIYWTRNALLPQKRTAKIHHPSVVYKGYLIHIFTASHQPPPSLQRRR
jgi:hypothetical protein